PPSLAPSLSPAPFPSPMPNRPPRNSGRESRNGPKVCHGNAGRLFYRTPLLQTRFQILGLYSPPGTTLERIATCHVECKTETRARPRETRLRQRQQLRIQTLRLLQRRQGLRAGQQHDLHGVRSEKL